MTIAMDAPKRDDLRTVGPRAGAAPVSGTVYRPDIDGLRTIAVVPVVLFHLDVTLFKGGFIGVDVFFVISGYLITGVLQSEIDASRFSLLRFYDRRIRRIFPALFSVILAAAVAAVLMLFPSEIIDFAHSTIAATLFWSNMYFMSVTDYFNSAGDTSPLLHTWSLAVEEQYYIVFPPLLYALRGFERRTVNLVIGVLAIGSFALSVHLVKSDQIAAFYLAPSRAWELLMGALLALKAVPPLRPAWLRQAAAALGAALIIAGCLLFYRNMPFPGTRALVPCIGAFLLLHAGASGTTLVGRVLSLKPMVFIGLISYSLYLWHWPIIVFARLWEPGAPGPIGISAVLVASFASATLSWRFVERPFRERKLAASPVMLRGFAVACMAASVLVGAGLIATGGLARAFPEEVVRLSAYLKYDDRAAYRRGSCFLDSHKDLLSAFDVSACETRAPGKPNLLVLGDSHAAHLWSGLSAAFPSVHVMEVAASGCKPVFDGKGHPTCLALVEGALDREMQSGAADSVLLSARWEPEDIGPLLKTVDRLAPHVKNVFVSGPIVEYRHSLPRILASSARDGDPGLPTGSRVDQQERTDRDMDQALKGHAAIYLSPYRTLCASPEKACRTVDDDGVPVQWDYGHLTSAGSLLIARAWKDTHELVFP